MNWKENDLSANSDADQTIIIMHHNPLWDTTGDSLLKKGYQGRDDLLSLIRTEGIDTVLSGHVHYDDVTIYNDTTYITTTTTSIYCDGDGYWGYRIITVENNILTSYNYKEPKYSIPCYQLNKREQNEQSITIENNLEQSASVLLEFIVPTDDYSVNRGTIIQIREQSGMVAAYMYTTIEAQTVTTITLS